MSLAILILNLTACAHLHREAAQTAEGAKAAAEPVVPASQRPPEDLRQDELLVVASDFREELMTWLRKNYRANHNKLARAAQKMISTHGVLYLANIRDLPERDRRYRMMRISEGKTLLFDTSGAVSGTCGELYIFVSVLDLNAGAPVLLTSQGPIALPMNTPGLYFEQTLLSTDDQPTPQALLSPTSDGPWNVEARARYIVWKYDLKMSLMENWWIRLARRYRDLREEHPFLALRISSEGFVVETSDRGLLPGQYEQVFAEKKGIVRRLYKPGGIKVDLADSCER